MEASTRLKNGRLLQVIVILEVQRKTDHLQCLMFIFKCLCIKGKYLECNTLLFKSWRLVRFENVFQKSL